MPLLPLFTATSAPTAVARLRLGAATPTGFRVGNATVTKVYLGTAVVWSPAAPVGAAGAPFKTFAPAATPDVGE